MAEGIWLISDKRIPLVPNIGIVEGEKRVLVIDSGLTSGSGRNVLKAAQTIARGREIILTVTHAHPEHTFGAQAFKGQAKIFYNSLQRDYLASNGQKLLKGFRPFLSPERVHLLDDIRITLANQVYTGNHASLDLGKRKVEFRNWGIAHSPGDQIVHIPDQNVTFAGDLIEERMFPIVPLFPPLINSADIKLSQWELALNHMIRLQPRIIVPGHGNLGGVEIARHMLDYFGEIRQFVGSLKAKGVAEVQARQQLELLVQRRHPTWERTEYIAPALRYISEQTYGSSK
ncbi:MBL fold metallo-hydrolase [bacterium]|nr:MAG: MBL fold metallo-hydrolase [bacterium]